MTPSAITRAPVSVVIPTFNRQSSTEHSLRSALAQTAAPEEILVVDDGSQEPFKLPPDLDARSDIRVLHLPANRGASAARQAGVDAARGRFIAFLDSDDVWATGKLEAQLALLKGGGTASEHLAAVVCGWEAVPESGKASRFRVPVASASACDFASGCWFSPGTTALVPRAAFETVGPFDTSLRRLEDLDWFLRFGLAGGQIMVAPIIGAVISIGRRGRLGAIDDAAKAILAKVDRIEDAALARRLRTRLRAYLDVERANAALGEGRYLAVAGYLGRSLALRPRLRIPLKAWWTEPTA